MTVLLLVGIILLAVGLIVDFGAVAAVALGMGKTFWDLFRKDNLGDGFLKSFAKLFGGAAVAIAIMAGANLLVAAGVVCIAIHFLQAFLAVAGA